MRDPFSHRWLRRASRGGLLALVLSAAACDLTPTSPDAGELPPADAGEPDGGHLLDAGRTDAGGTDAGRPDGGANDAGTRDAGTPDAGHPEWVYESGFHQALRWASAVDAGTTFRLKVPLGRSGDTVKVTFRAGNDGGMSLSGASIALAGSDGGLASAPVALTFGGNAGFTLGPSGEATSDEASFPVAFGAEVYVSFAIQGHVGSSTITNFADSWQWPGSSPSATGRPGDAVSWNTGSAVAFIDVHGPQTPVFVAIGDSITEGYSDGLPDQDYRKAWPYLVQQALGVPVLNSGVSGQDLVGEWLYGQAEIAPTAGLTDCVVLLGTNDLPCPSDAYLSSTMQDVVNMLQPMCHVWAGTLPPREVTTTGSEDDVKTCRAYFNNWILTQTQFAGIIDFAAVTQQSGDPDLWIPAYRVDGVHPNNAGQAAMAGAAAAILAPAADAGT